VKISRKNLRRLIEAALSDRDRNDADTAANQRYLSKSGKMGDMKAVMAIPEFFRLIKFYEDFGPDFHEDYYGLQSEDSPLSIVQAFHESTSGIGTDEGLMAAVLVSMKIKNISEESVEQEYQKLSQQDSSIMIDDYDSLREAIAKENSGDTQKFLLDILDDNVKITKVRSSGGRSSGAITFRTDRPYIDVENRDGTKKFTLYHEGNVFGADYVSLGDRRNTSSDY
jgi:hypothetical protein